MVVRVILSHLRAALAPCGPLCRLHVGGSALGGLELPLCPWPTSFLISIICALVWFPEQE